MNTRTRSVRSSLVAAVAVLGALLLAACSAQAQPKWTPKGATVAPSGATTAAGPATITILPASDAKDVAPGTPIQVTATGNAQVTAVTVSSGSKVIAGDLSADGKTWTSTGKLAFHTTYTVTVHATGAPSDTTTSTFSTAKAGKTITATLQANKLHALDNGGTYGIGQPVIVHFSKAVATAYRKTVEAAMQVTTTPAVDGAWHWVSSQEADYRGPDYWDSGTKIDIEANLYGVKFGGTTYGANNTHASITIGESHIAIADNDTHIMKVYMNFGHLSPGETPPTSSLVRTVKVSMGMGGSTMGAQGLVNYWTRTGPHIVLGKSDKVTMSSASYGVVDKSSKYYYAPETVYDDVQISYSGEYVHLRTWTVGDIGKRNSSHGCINVGIKDAPYMFKNFITGDIVDVVHTPVPISFANTQADWEMSWADWTK